MPETAHLEGRDLRSEAEALGPWFHNLHLPDGTQTAPDHPMGDFPHQNWLAFATRIPRDLTGQRVLDIGCNAGYYSFRLADRGADVTGVDLDERYLRQARWAREVLGHEDRVRFERRQVYDLRDEEPYDLVLFLGVMYHLRYPMLGLDIVRGLARDLLVFQTLETPEPQLAEPPPDLDFDDLQRLDGPGWPRMAFVPDRFAGDPTNWWVPNRAGVHAMLASAGFDIINDEGAPFFVCRVADSTPPQMGWNRSEFLAASGRPWKDHVEAKLVPRRGTLESPR